MSCLFLSVFGGSGLQSAAGSRHLDEWHEEPDPNEVVLLRCRCLIPTKVARCHAEKVAKCHAAKVVRCHAEPSAAVVRPASGMHEPIHHNRCRGDGAGNDDDDDDDDDNDEDDDDEEGMVAGFDGIPVPWLRTSATGGCWLKSAPAVDAEDAPSVP